MANEKRLIDANALAERFDKRIEWLRLDVHDKYSLGLYHGAATDKELIDEIPTVDAVEVVHGYWKEVTDEDEIVGEMDFYQCSVCGKLRWFETNYCPNCGAKMDKEEQHE